MQNAGGPPKKRAYGKTEFIAVKIHRGDHVIHNEIRRDAPAGFVRGCRRLADSRRFCEAPFEKLGYTAVL
jgi:hypothetical protein